MDDHDVVRRTRGYLPHWERDGAAYFVTFRLADSLPQDVRKRIEAKCKEELEEAGRTGLAMSPRDRARVGRQVSRRMEEALDSGAGSCALRVERIAAMMAGAIRRFDAERYDLVAWCIMPNHVHLVLQLKPGQILERIIHSLKTFTARAANRTLKRTGPFWQREYYDHLVRDEADLARVAAYVMNNPAKAGLANWPWVWSRP